MYGYKSASISSAMQLRVRLINQMKSMEKERGMGTGVECGTSRGFEGKVSVVREPNVNVMDEMFKGLGVTLLRDTCVEWWARILTTAEVDPNRTESYMNPRTGQG